MSSTTAAIAHHVLPRRNQAVASLCMLALMVGTCLAVDLLARNRSLEHWFMSKSSELADRNGVLFSDTGNFIDFEERVLLDEVPRADHGQGAIYFFGTSNTKWAFNTWDLPEDQKRRIGNYGLGAASHATVLRWIDLLVRQYGFLAGGTRDEVIIGASFHLGFRDNPNGFFASLVRRRGLYDVTGDGTVVSMPINALHRWLLIEKARSGGFIWNLGRLAKNWAKALRGPSALPPHTPETYRQAWREFMGPNWQRNMGAEMDRLRETIALVRSHHANIKVVLLPQGTWMDALPFPARYRELVQAVCRETSTPLIDLSRSMPDSDFVDSNHLTVKGQEKFRNVIMSAIKDQADGARPGARQP